MLPSSSRELNSTTLLTACFLGALQLQASRAGKKEAAEVAKVSAKVFLGHPEDPSIDGFGIRVEIIVEDFDDDAIIQAAHEVCSKSSIVIYSLLTFRPVLPVQPRINAWSRRQGHQGLDILLIVYTLLA